MWLILSIVNKKTIEQRIYTVGFSFLALVKDLSSLNLREKRISHEAPSKAAVRG